MATPLLSSVFKPTDFDVFLDELGYSDLQGEDRVQIVDRFTQAVEYALVSRILRNLPIPKQTEWIGLMQQADKTGDETPVNDFLAREYPEIETLVDEVIENVKNEFRLSAATVSYDIDKQLAMLGRTGEDSEVEAVGATAADVESVRNELNNLPPAPIAPAIGHTSTDDALSEELASVDNNSSIG